jgi:hypothetical protein
MCLFSLQMADKFISGNTDIKYPFRFWACFSVFLCSPSFHNIPSDISDGRKLVRSPTSDDMMSYAVVHRHQITQRHISNDSNVYSLRLTLKIA